MGPRRGGAPRGGTDRERVSTLLDFRFPNAAQEVDHSRDAERQP